MSDADFESHLRMSDPASAIQAGDVFWNARRQLEPEADLMKAILDCSIADLQRTRINQNRNRNYQNALDWFMSDSADWIFSFVSICGVLNLSPSATRKMILGDRIKRREYRKKEGGNG